MGKVPPKKSLSSEDLLDFSRFSPLSCCLFVDPDEQVRGEIARALKASLLFEHLSESGTLVNIAAKLQNLRFDACLFGPSLPMHAVADFAQRQKTLSLANDCAFVALAGGQAARFLRNRPGTLHLVIEWPCTKHAFFAGLVRGVLLANKGTVWPGIRLREDGVIVIRRESGWVELGDMALNDVLPGEQQKQPSFEIPDLDTLLRKLIEHINNPEQGPAADDEFASYFEECLEDWRTGRSASPLEAVRKLRRRLMSYKNRSGPSSR